MKSGYRRTDFWDLIFVHTRGGWKLGILDRFLRFDFSGKAMRNFVCTMGIERVGLIFAI